MVLLLEGGMEGGRGELGRKTDADACMSMMNDDNEDFFCDP